MRLMLVRFFLLAVINIIIDNQDALHAQVDPLTGRAVVTIPLGQVSALDLSVGISLAHHGGALRVAEGPGNAGMGWNVNLFAGISREVRGLPDELTGTKVGWLSNATGTTIQGFNSSADDNLSVCTDETNDWNFINGLNYNIDPEPDIYYFQAPGISGKFIFGADGLAKLIPYQDLQVTYASGSFTIKTNTGIVYSFSTAESTTRQSFQYKTSTVSVFKSDYNFYTAPITFTSAWNLSGVVSNATGAMISYTYADGELAESNRYVTRIQPNGAGQATTSVDTLYSIRDLTTPKNLSTIALQSYRINVGWANELIDYITIQETESGESKGYDFVYYSYTATSPNHQPATKPFLSEVKQQNSCVAYPSYAFSYNTTGASSMPWVTNWGQDIFGYYNGLVSNKNIPTVYFYQSEAGARRYRVTPIPGGTPTQTLNGVSATTSSMNVDPTYSGFGVLTQINYPTGGTTTYTYEPNKYYDASTSEELFGPGVRVSSVTTAGRDAAYGKQNSTNPTWHALTKTYEYTLSGSTTTSGTVVNPPAFAFTDGTSVFRSQTDIGGGAQVLYSRVKEVTPGLGYKVYNFEMPNVYPDVAPTVSWGKVARAAGGACSVGLLQNGVYNFPFAPSQDFEFKRGLLKKVSEYDPNNVLTSERRMTYTQPQSSVTIKALKYEAITNGGAETFYFSTYLIPVAQSRIVSQEIVKNISEQSADSIKTTTAYTYNSKNMPVQTSVTGADNSVSNRYIKYAIDYAITSPTAGDQQANAIYKLNAANRYGEVIESYQAFTPAGSTSVTSAQLNLYKDYGAGSYVFPYQVKQFPQGMTFTPSSASTGATQGFISDTKYIGGPVLEYSSSSPLPMNSVDQSVIITGTHYSSGTTLPLARFVNCRAENAVYEGFEMTNTRGLVLTGTSSPASSGWTGQKSANITTSGYALTATNVTKGSNTYRVSCWVLGSQNATITVQATSSPNQATTTLTYNTPNQWQYLTATLDVTALGNFSMSVGSNAAIQLDDFVAMPSTARVSTTTYLPMTGVTSQTDDRGNSTVIAYDIMGRKVNTLDRKRNTTQLVEYSLQRQGVQALNANFISNTSRYLAGQPVTFTAAATCIPGATYAWTFTDAAGTVTTGSGSTINYTFNSTGVNLIQLTASAPGYSSVSFTDNICVEPGSYSVTVSIAAKAGVTNVAQFDRCSASDDGVRTFSASFTGASLPGYTISYKWYITDVNGNWIAPTLLNLPPVKANKIDVQCPAYTYQVRCDVSAVMTAPNYQCNWNPPLGSNSAGVTYLNTQQCP